MTVAVSDESSNFIDVEYTEMNWCLQTLQEQIEDIRNRLTAAFPKNKCYGKSCNSMLAEIRNIQSALVEAK